MIQKLIDKLNLISRENLSGLMVVRSFGTQEYEKKRFDVANSDLTKTNLFVNRVMVFMMPMMMLIMNGVNFTNRLGWCPSNCGFFNAGRGYDGVYAICHANFDVLYDAIDDVYS